MSTKIKVLHVIPRFGTGGAERLVLDLLENTDTKKFDVAAVSLYGETGTIFEREIRDKDLKVYYLGKHKGLDLSMIPKLHKVIKRYMPDVVHSHLYVLRYTLLPTILCQVPVRVHTFHSVAQKEVDQIGKLIDRIAFTFGGVVPVSISENVADSVHVVYGAKLQTPVIYNGVDTKKFACSNCKSEKQEGEEIILLHVGRFSPAKDHKLLIEAFFNALKQCPTLRLWLVGDGELRPAIEQMVRDRGLEDEVSFLGVRSDIPELMAKSDIFVLSSEWEGVPLSVIEAMAAGKPVVGTAVGGVPEIVKEGLTGFLVPSGDANAFCQAIVRLARDKELRQSMGEEGRRIATERFDISRTAKEYEQLYSTLLMARSRKR